MAGDLVLRVLSASNLVGGSLRITTEWTKVNFPNEIQPYPVVLVGTFQLHRNNYGSTKILAASERNVLLPKPRRRAL